MAQATRDPDAGRDRRKRPEITRLSDTTPFGHAVTHCTFAISEVPTASAKLRLIVDVAKYLLRQANEIERHQRGRQRRGQP
jgi:hypothetical protein